MILMSGNVIYFLLELSCFIINFVRPTVRFVGNMINTVVIVVKFFVLLMRILLNNLYLAPLQ